MPMFSATKSEKALLEPQSISPKQTSQSGWTDHTWTNTNWVLTTQVVGSCGLRKIQRNPTASKSLDVLCIHPGSGKIPLRFCFVHKKEASF